MTTTQVPIAKRVKQANAAYSAAWRVMMAAEAEQLRLLIVELADQHPGLDSVQFDIEYVSDKGHFWESASGSATVDESVDGQEAAYDEHGDPSDVVMDMNPSPELLRFMINDVDAIDETVEFKVDWLRGESWPETTEPPTAEFDLVVAAVAAAIASTMADLRADIEIGSGPEIEADAVALAIGDKTARRLAELRSGFDKNAFIAACNFGDPIPTEAFRP